jgi:alanyl-tRNA synthetase
MRDHRSIRNGFLDYFAGHGHERVASYSLIPPADPTLLFVNAGMVQFKDVFVGLRKLPYVRATTSQKCLRVSGKHNDLENVGRTPRHHTFFEMLGNFSFGDYFKRDAIRFGWEFLTQVAGLPKDRLWVTVHPDDDEARKLWLNDQGVAADRIVTDPSNVWSMGDTGPTGPCSEVHWDKGEQYGPGEHFFGGYEGRRFVELWNLVFMQFERSADGTVKPLPRPSIDTGMGLERLAAVLQGVESNYETDLFMPLIRLTEGLGGNGKRFLMPGGQEDDNVAFRVIADHARASTFLITDGIYPENEGRGYVLRRLMRRAIRFGRKLGLEGEFLARVCDGVVENMGADYPEIVEKRDIIQRYVQAEEERFGKTLNDGLAILEPRLKAALEGRQVLDGKTAFLLQDTYGFPLDLTQLIAEERGVKVDEAGFQAEMQAQRERGRASWKGAALDQGGLEAFAQSGGQSRFLGYETEQAEATVTALFRDGRELEQAEAGTDVLLVADATPFYPEQGGQMGDVGSIVAADRVVARVKDTKRPAPGVIAHHVRLDAPIHVGDRVRLVVDHERRAATRRNHTATHLLQNALRTVLGDHVKQRGSLVDPERLRFDFSHFAAVTLDQIEAAEAHVNRMVCEDVPVVTEEKSLEQAVKDGAIAFFEEKYGDTVRVVQVRGADHRSAELCGGTHVARTGQIGAFVIVSEGSVSSGVRRIEALTGVAAMDQMHRSRRLLTCLRSQCAGVAAEALPEKIEAMQKALKEAEGQLSALRAKLAGSSIDADLAGGKRIGPALAVVKETEGLGGNEAAELCDRLRERMEAGAVLLLNRQESGSVAALVAVTPRLSSGQEGISLHAGNILKEVAQAAGGKGGGKPDMARGGLPDASRNDLARAAFYRIIASQLGIQGS